MFSHHYESSAFVEAPVDKVFAHVDDHARLSSHMSQSSWMMGGGRMEVEVDDGHGRRVGSRVRVAGRVFGVQLSVEEVVTERNLPHRKVWETTAPPRLLVIGHYRMGFEIAPRENSSLLRVFIDYDLPDAAPARWLGYLFGGQYAKWCTKRMAHDTAEHFGSATGSVLMALGR